MAANWRVVVRGNALGQEIQNTFYYGHSDGGDVVDNAQDANAIQEFFNGDFKTEYLSHLPSYYSGESLVVDVVDQFGKTMSPVSYEYSFLGDGVSFQPSDGVGMAAIINFKCGVYRVSPSLRVPRRSHIRYGPLISDLIDTDQGLSQNFRLDMVPLLGLMIETITVGATEPLIPTRVGVANKDGVGAMGRVNSIILRPNARSVKSRMFSATGR